MSKVLTGKALDNDGGRRAAILLARLGSVHDEGASDE